MTWTSAFILTAATETTIVGVLGLRSGREVASVLSVNLITHPGFFLLASFSFPALFWQDYALGLAISEFSIVIAEAALLKWTWPRRKWLELLVLSFSANSASLLAGIALLWH